MVFGVVIFLIAMQGALGDLPDFCDGMINQAIAIGATAKELGPRNQLIEIVRTSFQPTIDGIQSELQQTMADITNNPKIKKVAKNRALRVQKASSKSLQDHLRSIGITVAIFVVSDKPKSKQELIAYCQSSKRSFESVKEKLITDMQTFSQNLAKVSLPLFLNGSMSKKFLFVSVGA